MTSKPAGEQTGQNIYIDVLRYLGAEIRNGAIPIGHPKLRGYLKLSMTPVPRVKLCHPSRAAVR